MRTDRRGFIGALLAAPFAAKLLPAAVTKRIWVDSGNVSIEWPLQGRSYDQAFERALAAYRAAHDRWQNQLFADFPIKPS